MQSISDSLKFKSWKAELEKNGIILNGVQELHSIRKRNGEVLFALLNIDAKDPEGKPLLPVVMLRGHFVCVVTCLVDRDSREKFMLLVTQRRVAFGGISYEHPAGMMDEDGDPFEVACKEVEEETGVKIDKSTLSLLWPQPIYSSPGLLDEGGWFLACTLEMSGDEIRALHHSEAGHGGEGEFINTYVVKEAEALQLMNNASAMLAQTLWENRAH